MRTAARWIALVGCALGPLRVEAHAVPRLAPAEPDGKVRTAPVSVAGTPRSLVSVAIAIPSELQEADSVAFRVVMRTGVEVLGRRAGRLERHPETGEWRPVLLTVRVPATARTGLIEVADIEFDAFDDGIVAVPLVLRVPTVTDLRLEGARSFGQLIPGDRLDVTYRVHNDGNARESLLLESRVPMGWRARMIDTLRLVVEPFATVEARVTVRVPVGTSRGEYYAAVNLFRVGVDSLTVPTAVTSLLVSGGNEIASGGLTLRPLTAVTATSAGSGIVGGLRADGYVADGVRVQAQWLPQAPRTGLETIALASVGALGNPFQANVTAETWTADVGFVSADQSALTGVLAVAEGLTARYARDGMTVRGFAGRSGLQGAATGAHVGAGVWMPTAFGEVGLMASSRREDFGGGFARELTAVGMEWNRVVRPGLSLNSGLAVRNTATGTGLGFRLEGNRDYSRGRVRAAYVHAAGGSGGFAVGVDNFDVEATHEFTERWRGNGSLRVVRDEAPTGLETQSLVLGVGQTYDWTDATQFSLVGTASRFSGRAGGGALGAFGSTNLLSSLGVSQRRHAWMLGAIAQLGIVGRDAALTSGGASAVRVLQRGLQLTAARPIPRVGELSFGGSRVLTGAGAGQPTDVTSVFGRFGSSAVMIGAIPVRGSAELQLLSTPFASSLVGWRMGVAMPLPRELELETSLERNPFFLDRNGRAGWALAMRVTAATSVFTPKRAGLSGLVFEDRNGNGERDSDEPGVAGVRVTLGEMRFTTDRDGRYTLPRGVRGRVRADVGTLPDGWLVHPQMSTGVEETLDLPLIRTGGVSITLAIAADEDGRRPDVDLTESLVWLVDRDGREWLGRASTDGRRIEFENIPAGRYLVRADLSRLSEPLRVADGEQLEVRPGQRDPHVVSLRGRVIRLIQPPSRGGTGRGGRGGRGSGLRGGTGDR